MAVNAVVLIWKLSRMSILTMRGFGESAPAKDLYAHFGSTVARLVDAVRTLTAADQRQA